MQVTTSSLEALKQYSIAIENHRAGHFGEARTYYENALALDPNFAAAKASLGMIHYEAAQDRAQRAVVQFEGIDPDLGRRLLAEAVGQIENLTDRERCGIQAFHARAVENDLPRAIQHLKTLVGLYPDDSSAHNNLGWFYGQMGRFDEAIVEFKEAMRSDPTPMLAYDALNGIYLYEQGRISDAIALCKAQILVNDRHYQLYDNLGWALAGRGEYEKAAAAFEKAAELNPRFTTSLFRIAHCRRLLGRYREALEPLDRIPESADRAVLYQKGILYQLLNDSAAARKHFERYRDMVERDLRKYPKNGFLTVERVLVLVRLGQTARALAARQEALSVTGDDSLGAALASAVLGMTDEALDQLELAVKKDLHNYIWIKVHPDLQNLYGNPRFEALVNRNIK